MMKFHIPEMSCGHCVASIEKAVKSADPAAIVPPDLTLRTSEIDATVSTAALMQVLAAAGHLSGRPAGVGACELDVRKCRQHGGFVDPHEINSFDHKGVAMVVLREDRRFRETRSGHYTVDHEALAIRSKPLKMHAPA